MQLLIFGDEQLVEDSFVQYLRQSNYDLIFTNEEDIALTLLKSGGIAIVISPDGAMSKVRNFIKQNPMVNYALLSEKSSEIFHQRTEGLGIFMQLPAYPDKNDALKMHERLHVLLQHTTMIKGTTE